MPRRERKVGGCSKQDGRRTHSTQDPHPQLAFGRHDRADKPILVSLRLNPKNDSVRQVDEMPNLKSEFVLLGDHSATFRHFFQRKDRRNKPTKPSLGGFWFFPNITNEPDVGLSVRQSLIGDVNVEGQAFPQDPQGPSEPVESGPSPQRQCQFG